MEIDIIIPKLTADISRVYIKSNDTQSDYICANYIDVRIIVFYYFYHYCVFRDIIILEHF